MLISKDDFQIIFEVLFNEKRNLKFFQLGLLIAQALFALLSTGLCAAQTVSPIRTNAN
jgi:hypothetical protein